MIAALTVDFGKLEAWVAMKFLVFSKVKEKAEIQGKIKEIMKNGCPSYSIVKNWVSRFHTSHFEVTDEPWSGWPTSTTTEDKADAVHIMILENHWISARVIGETLGISCVNVGHIIQNILDMRKLSSKWLLKCQNADQQCFRGMTSKAIWGQFSVGEADLKAHLITMDETWLHHYDPQTK
ncbi:uncharacterized protein LOC115224436 [Octopus sinensis]|uniref:Uncharacterized protein LOC115224436 n=1 Tax=Octopus sinensis TaxID=2607531 RepID=A0A6P7TP08_9MOLL|nr:uncharacterized protein LOC115224436 [Octopus sinensis]